MKLYLYILGTVLFNVYGQLIIKWRIVDLNFSFSRSSGAVDMLKFILDPYVLSGIISAFVAMIMWILTLSLSEISYSYPIILSGMLMLTTFLGILFFGESIPISKVIAIVVIMIGIFILSYK